MSALDAFKAMQFAIGWKVPEVGLARVQFIGNNRAAYRWGEQGGSSGIVNVEKRLAIGMNTNKDSDIIQAAFLFDRIDGLIVDVGVTVPLAYTTDSKDFEIYPRVVGTDGKAYEPIVNAAKAEFDVQDPYVIAAAVSWKTFFLPALNLTLRADISLGGKKDSTDKNVETGMGVNAWFMPSYVIGTTSIGTWKVGLDMGMEMHGKDKLTQVGINPNKAVTDVSEFIDFGAAAWGELGFEGGRFRFGVSMMFPGSERYSYNASSPTYRYSPKYTGDPVISIPISYTYSF
jgi:hypothetical protein